MSLDGKSLFGREYNVVVAPSGTLFGLDVSKLRCEFKVKKTLKPDPNTCTVKIYNLAEASRFLLESADKLMLRLEAGYVDTGTSQLFLGEVRNAWSQAESTEIVTTITTGDSAKEIQEARLSITTGAGVSVDIAMRAIVAAMKIGPGNIEQAIALVRAGGAAQFYGAGSAVSGNAGQIMTDTCRSAGLEWSVLDGNLQILLRNKPSSPQAINLSASTGLVGSPQVDFSSSSKAKKGGLQVKAKCFIMPDLNPGKLVVFDSKFVTGGYRIEEVEYEGDTHADPWHAHLTCRAL